MQNDIENKEAINALISGIQLMCQQLIQQSTVIYDGLIVSDNANAQGKWNIRYNGKLHEIKPYGNVVPQKGKMVKVIIPQGNQALAFFI